MYERRAHLFHFIPINKKKGIIFKSELTIYFFGEYLSYHITYAFRKISI